MVVEVLSLPFSQLLLFFFEFGKVGEMGNQLGESNWNCGSEFAAYEEFSWTVTVFQWGRTVCKQGCIGVSILIQKTFDCPHCPLHSPITLWVPRATCDVSKSILL